MPRRGTTVFILWHSRPVDGDDTEDKLLGVYSSRERAVERAERAKHTAGFRDYPEDFVISEYQLDTDHWTEGFQEQTLRRPARRAIPLP